MFYYLTLLHVASSCVSNLLDGKALLIRNGCSIDSIYSIVEDSTACLKQLTPQ